jgi:hypothetical protein
MLAAAFWVMVIATLSASLKERGRVKGGFAAVLAVFGHA